MTSGAESASVLKLVLSLSTRRRTIYRLRAKSQTSYEVGSGFKLLPTWQEPLASPCELRLVATPTVAHTARLQDLLLTLTSKPGTGTVAWGRLLAVGDQSSSNSRAKTGDSDAARFLVRLQCPSPYSTRLDCISPDGAGGQRGDDEHPSAEGHPERMMILI